MENENHRLSADPKPREGAVPRRHSLTMKLDFMRLAEAALCDADLNPFCSVSAKAGDWGILKC